MGVLIRNGTIVTPLDQWVGDIRCVEGRIVELGPNLEAGGGDEVVDASDQLVFPGGLDPHVHLELPLGGTVSADDFESGTAAAVAGGTTSIIDFCTPDRGRDLLDALRERREQARKSVIDHALHMAVTWWGDDTRRRMRACVEDEGITSFKVFMAYRDTVGIDDADLIRVLRTAGELGAVVAVHAEHGELIEDLRARFAAAGRTEPRFHARSRPPAAEGEATARVLMLARMTGAIVYVVHMTCRESLAALARAREEGQRAFGETCPQYLLLDDRVYLKPDLEAAAYVMSPPIRPRGHQDALWAALGSGTLQSVGTDHCPFTQTQKAAGLDDFRRIPNGAAGIETRLPLLYSYGVRQGRLSLQQFVAVTSTLPAKIFGLYPRKGSITIGADADLVIWDPAATHSISASTHHQRTDRSIFEGVDLVGMPSTVVVGGQVRLHRGDLRVERGAGRYLARGAVAPAP